MSEPNRNSILIQVDQNRFCIKRMPRLESDMAFRLHYFASQLNDHAPLKKALSSRACLKSCLIYTLCCICVTFPCAPFVCCQIRDNEKKIVELASEFCRNNKGILMPYFALMKKGNDYVWVQDGKITIKIFLGSRFPHPRHFEPSASPLMPNTQPLYPPQNAQQFNLPQPRQMNPLSPQNLERVEPQVRNLETERAPLAPVIEENPQRQEDTKVYNPPDFIPIFVFDTSSNELETSKIKRIQYVRLTDLEK